MGHVLLGPLPRTRKWKQVVGMIAGGAGAPQVATATARAANRWLRDAANDHGVIESIWLLMQLPLAARTDDFTAALRACGVKVSDEPGLIEIVSAVTAAIDAKMPHNEGRTDLGEMAQMAAGECLTQVIGGRLNNLFDSTPAEVQREFALLATSMQFGILARDFFSRLTDRVLNFFLSKTLPDHIGQGKAFGTLSQQRDFSNALDIHCREAGKILERFSGEWLMKHKFESKGAITRKMAAAFTAHAMTKLTKELQKRADDVPPS